MLWLATKECQARSAYHFYIQPAELFHKKFLKPLLYKGFSRFG